MRYLGLSLALLATGCTLQITPIGLNGSPGASPMPGESPKPGRSASPAVKASASPGTPASPAASGPPSPAKCDALFKQLDASGDGQLSADEYVQGLLPIYTAQHKGDPPNPCGPPNEPFLLKAAFRFLDRDQDGQASPTEFADECAGKGSKHVSQARCDADFAAQDQDQDGRWSLAEFQRGWADPNAQGRGIFPRDMARFRLLCSPVAAPNYAHLFKQVDENGDGAVDKREWCSLSLGERTVTLYPPPPDAEPAPPALTGTWTIAPDDQAVGPLHLDPCAKYRRYYFPVQNNGGTNPGVVVTDENAGPMRGYSSEKLTIVPVDGRNTWRFEGSETAPGPTDAPEDHPVVYELRYDAKAHVLAGSRTVKGQPAQPIRLIETDVTGPCRAGTASAPPASPGPGWPPPKESVVFQVRYSGGLCAGGPCGSTLAFRGTGAFTRDGKAGKVAESIVEAVTLQAQWADFAAIKSHKFTGTCPTAWDGSEVTYVFTTSHGEEVIPSCTFAVDEQHPLFAAAGKAIAAANQSQ